MAQMEFRHAEREVTEAHLFGIGRIEAQRQRVSRQPPRDNPAAVSGIPTVAVPRIVQVERQRALDRLFGFIDAALRRQHQASHVVGAGIVGCSARDRSIACAASAIWL